MEGQYCWHKHPCNSERNIILLTSIFKFRREPIKFCINKCFGWIFMECILTAIFSILLPSQLILFKIVCFLWTDEYRSWYGGLSSKFLIANNSKTQTNSYKSKILFGRCSSPRLLVEVLSQCNYDMFNHIKKLEDKMLHSVLSSVMVFPLVWKQMLISREQLIVKYIVCVTKSQCWFTRFVAWWKSSKIQRIKQLFSPCCISQKSHLG